MDNAESLKEYLRGINRMTIRADGLALYSGYEIGAGMTCRSWTIAVHFDFTELEDVMMTFDPGYRKCNIQRDDSNGSSTHPIIFKDIYFFNFLCLIFYLGYTITVISALVEVVRYRFLEEDKHRKYRWLLRIRKNFFG